MSYLGTALSKVLERRHMNQTDLARHSGVSRSYISRLCSGEARDLSDANFTAVLNVFVTDPVAQADLTAARCMDVRIGPAAHLVDISVNIDQATPRAAAAVAERQLPDVRLSHETEKAIDWLRRQCPINPDVEKHLVGFAKLTGMK